MDNDFKEFLLGIRTVTRREMMYSREDLPNGVVLIHVLDVETGKEFDRYWGRKNDKGELKLYRQRKRKKNNYTGGQKPFTKVYQHHVSELLLSDKFGTLPERKNQAYLLLFLMDYADRGTGKIHKRCKKGKDDRLLQSDIVEITGMSKATVSKSIKLMIQNEVIKFIDGYYHLAWRYAGRD